MKDGLVDGGGFVSNNKISQKRWKKVEALRRYQRVKMDGWV